MRYPHFSIDADIGLFIVIIVFTIVGIFNAVKLGYIKKKNIPIIILIIIILLLTGFLLR